MQVKDINETVPFYVESVEINAPKDFVFKFLSDYQKNGTWIKGLKEETFNKVDGNVGSTFEEKIKMYGSKEEYTGKVLAYEDRKMYQIEIGSKWVDFKIEYDFEDVPTDKTHLTETAWILKGTSLYKLFKSIDRHILHKQLLKLKEVVEADYKASK